MSLAWDLTDWRNPYDSSVVIPWFECLWRYPPEWLSQHANTTWKRIRKTTVWTCLTNFTQPVPEVNCLNRSALRLPGGAVSGLRAAVDTWTDQALKLCRSKLIKEKVKKKCQKTSLFFENANMFSHVCNFVHVCGDPLRFFGFDEVSWIVLTCLDLPESLARRRHKVSLLSAAIEIGALGAKHQNLFPRDSRRMCELVV